MKNIKKISNFFIFILLFSVIFNSCKKEDEPEPIPPALNILTEDTTGTLGALTVDILYVHNYELSAAPSLTDVHLYESIDAYMLGVPLFKTWTISTDYTVEFGYLNPGTYYVLAFTRIGSYDYEALMAAQVNAGKERIYDVIMERVVIQ